MHRLSLSALALATFAVAQTSCGITSGTMSCTLVKNGVPEQCIEYYDFAALSSVNAKASLQILCNAFQADITERLCDATTALVGCKETKDNNAWTQTTWFYPVDGKMTAGSFSCQSRQTKLGPDREPLITTEPTQDMTMACSGPSVTATTITFKNNTNGPVSMYWVNYECQEAYYATIAAGASKEQSTFVGHPWRIRTGDQNATGTVVKEFTATAADAPTVTVNIP